MYELRRIYEYSGLDAAIEHAKKMRGLGDFIKTWGPHCGSDIDTFCGQLIVSLMEAHKSE